jgi:type I restriction enzyme S subunit
MLDAARPRGVTRVPYLRNLNVQWGRIDLDDVQEVLLNEDEKQRFALEPGDLLVCEGGDIGRAAIWRGGPQYMAYQKALHRVRSRGELDHSYLR